MSPGLEGLALCTRCPVGPSSETPSSLEQGALGVHACILCCSWTQIRMDLPGQGAVPQLGCLQGLAMTTTSVLVGGVQAFSAAG